MGQRQDWPDLDVLSGRARGRSAFGKDGCIPARPRAARLSLAGPAAERSGGPRLIHNRTTLQPGKYRMAERSPEHEPSEPAESDESKRNKTLVAGLAFGIGSAAIVAALLYANRAK